MMGKAEVKPDEGISDEAGLYKARACSRAAGEVLRL